MEISKKYGLLHCCAFWSKIINIVEVPGLEGTTAHDSLAMDKISLESVYNKSRGIT
jgi:hypothetical protein